MKNLIFLLFLMALVGCKSESKEESKSVTIKEDVIFLSDDKLEGRQTGTEGERKAAEYIASRFEGLGLAGKGTDGYYQSFTFKPKTDPHQEVNYTVKDGDSTITGTNVVAFLNNNADHTVIIGAHYDHLGYGAEGSLYRGDKKEIHNGADDNASGVAVMLNLAEKLKTQNTGNNYLFMAFSGEEMGLLGSNYWNKNTTIDIATANYMLNMDMVGRLKQDSTLAVYGLGTSPILKQVVKSNNSKFKIIENESGIGPSDHTSFYNSDVPVLHFFTGQHEDYHKPSDDYDKLNYEGMADISEYILAIITDLDDNGKLPFRKTKNESEDVPRFKVGLGVIPDYLYDGEGMRIDGVSEDKPAQRAGLQKGDIVVKLGDSLVTDMMSYMRALSAFDSGDKTKVVVKRNGEDVEANIEFNK
ncbi:M28 family peptidase [Psychroserpens sp.]|uniref:M28 family peptidase n=1 Tax=Psychroserpens sp. TaxID=2020870 RepID=UPI001B07F1DF|nr:M28 family peptidase [Psychroserpens sp.]MBO6605324.1 M28 family peptidase [Psychroserpens sp.]MBO6629993.1 M28 family peptidase [Psychroserpens sp.]MBO6653867.1 M28 family peptidase [Psychroserpens sp.]MBO6682188.1 M28 family peptidase [Psychroserpens sp.]MBO6748698.1 M28 family peptidase [Psychroserpens sp.]